MKSLNGKKMTTFGIIAALSLLTAAPLFADTMVVIDDETSADEVTGILELPEGASTEGVAHSTSGLEVANAAREGGREFGEQQAADARSRGQDARESAGAGTRDSVGSASDAADTRGPGGIR